VEKSFDLPVPNAEKNHTIASTLHIYNQANQVDSLDSGEFDKNNKNKDIKVFSRNQDKAKNDTVSPGPIKTKIKHSS